MTLFIEALTARKLGLAISLAFWFFAAVLNSPALLSDHSVYGNDDTVHFNGKMQFNDDPTAWFNQARQCPEIDFEKTFGLRDGNTVTIGYDEGLECMGEAFINNCEEVWAAAAGRGSDIAAITMVGGQCAIAFRTELSEDYYACDPYGFFLEYMETIGQVIDLSESSFLNMMSENPVAGMANVLALQSVQYLNSRTYLESAFSTCSWIEL